MKYQHPRKNRIRRKSRSPRSKWLSFSHRPRRRSGRTRVIRLPGGLTLQRSTLLLVVAAAAILLALSFRLHSGAPVVPDGVQMSFAYNGTTSPLEADPSQQPVGTSARQPVDSSSLQWMDGALLAGTSAEGGSSADFPADFSADLCTDPSESFVAPLSRGASGSGAAIATLAVSRLGDACFQPSVSSGEYLDCSSLVQWCYSHLGISVPRTAAEQAEYCQNNGFTVSRSQLQCGDLIFWSFEKNGRFKDISHTGIYAGNGKIIDASYSRSQVVYRNLYSPEQIVMCGRIPAGR